MGECVRGMERKVEAIKVQEIDRESIGSEEEMEGVEGTVKGMKVEEKRIEQTVRWTEGEMEGIEREM